MKTRIGASAVVVIIGFLSVLVWKVVTVDASSDPDEVLINAQVLDGKDAPVRGADVYLCSLETPHFIMHMGQSDEKGVFTVKNGPKIPRHDFSLYFFLKESGQASSGPFATFPMQTIVVHLVPPRPDSAATALAYVDATNRLLTFMRLEGPDSAIDRNPILLHDFAEDLQLIQRNWKDDDKYGELIQHQVERGKADIAALGPMDKPMRGTLVSVQADAGKIVMTDSDGKDINLTVGKDAKITFEGKEALLKDLKRGSKVKVTIRKDGDQNVVVKMEVESN